MKISADTFGNKNNPAVLLIHPFPFDARLWTEVAEKLSDKYFVVTPDLRGCGKSELGSDQPDLELLAQDVNELIKELNLVNPIIGGISLGGYVAMAMLRQGNQNYSGLILVDTKAAADGDAARENRLRVAEQMKEHGKVGLFAEQMLTNVVGTYTHEHRNDVVAQVKQWMNESSAGTIAWLQTGMAARPESFSTLSKFNGPTLLIRGSEDAISTAQDFLEMQNALEKNQGQAPSSSVTFVELLNAGHLPPVEDSAQTAKVIGDWLAKVTSVNH